MYKGVRYYVANIHMHTPAEHRLNGQEYPLEVHVVHANKVANKFIVLVTVFEYPTENDYAAVIHREASESYGENRFVKRVLNAVVNDIPSFMVFLGGITDISQGVCAYKGLSLIHI